MQHLHLHWHTRGRLLALLLVLALLLSTFAFAADSLETGLPEGETEPVSVVTADPEQEAEPGIVSVYGIGFVDADGGKLKAIAVQYGTEMTKDIALEDYEIQDYGILEEPSCELGENPGAATKIYVNTEAAVSAAGGTETGYYVIIEVNTDYQLASVPDYQDAMVCGVKQLNGLTDAAGNPVPATEDYIVNYESVAQQDWDGNTYWVNQAIDGMYEFTDLTGFQLFYKDGVDNGVYGGYDTTSAFWAYDCFDEEDGELHDVELPYALYVPDDWTEDGNYGLVLEIENAGFLGEDPMIVITESKAAATYASADLQQYFKETTGLDGLIVVAPQIENSIRTTRDNWSISCGVAATWQLLDYLTEAYKVDSGYIYGTGESMGGMQVLCMASQRDNYFAGLWLRGCQWGSCYNLEQEYSGASYYMSDDDTIWRVDADGKSTEETNSLGEEVVARNLYYLISDDNILVNSCTGDSFATGVWKEIWYLFYDIGGVQIPYSSISPLEDSQSSINQTLIDLLKEDNDTGIYWMQQDGGSHMLTWVYADKMDPGYYWLLSQTQADENTRNKITQFTSAWQAETDEEVIEAVHNDGVGPGRLCGTQSDGTEVYYAVPAEGAGTSGYNSYWASRGVPMSGKEPGWTVSTMTVRMGGSSNGTAINDSSYDDLYGDLTAEEGVRALLAEGKISINGVAIDGETSVNGALGLWQEEDGTWSWKTHIMHSGNEETYEEAAYQFAVWSSKLGGPTYTMTLLNGKVQSIEMFIMDGAFAQTVTIGETTTTLTICGEGDGSMDRANPSTLVFDNACVEADKDGNLPSDQCMVLYYQDGDGIWHLKRADSEIVTVNDDYTFDSSGINIEYSQAWNRPSQPVAAVGWMGLGDTSMYAWYYDYDDAVICGFSTVNGYDNLTAAVEKAQAYLDLLHVSEDGTDIAVTDLWVTQAEYDEYAAVVANATEVASNPNLYNTAYDEAFFSLAQMYGCNFEGDGIILGDGYGIIYHAAYGTAVAYDTGTGDTGTGNTGTSDTDTGNTGAGDTGTGDANTGNAGTGDTGASNTGTGSTGTNNSGSAQSPQTSETTSAIMIIAAICFLALAGAFTGLARKRREV